MDINSENSQNNIQLRKLITKDLTDVLIRFALVIFLVFISLKIFSLFMGLMLWALILAGVLIIGGPTIMLGGSLADFVQETHTSIKNDTFTLKQPPQSVAKWPVVGKKIYSVWQHPATDFISGILQFIFSMIIAGIMLAQGKEGSEAMPVVLLGALGGMVATGLLGLFIGAVFLSLAYVIFMNWVEDGIKDMRAMQALENNARSE